MSYTQGDLIELPAEFRNTATGALTDPTTLSLRVVAPDNTLTTYPYPGANISRTALGTFLGVVPGDQSGSYQYEWVLTGNLQGVEPGSFYVEAALPGAAAYRRIRSRLARLVAASSAPVLDDAALDDLMTRARRPDASGVLPSAVGWTPTWDLNGAAADGWEIKAGLAAGDYNFAASGQRFDRSQVHDACMKMATLYRRGSGSARVTAGAVDDYTAAMLEGLTPGPSILL